MVPARVMLVEDERIVALNIKRRLVALGYEVPASAVSGAQALAQMRTVHPDIVLMDINIEGDMDGVDTATQIPNDLHIPVIYLTAYSGDETLERARATRPYGYLLKPFSERELHATIQMALARRDAEIALRNSEERLRLALEAAEIGIWELDTGNYQLEFMGPPELFFGFPETVFSGNWKNFLETVHVADRDLVNSVLTWTLTDNRLCQVEFRNTASGDKQRWLKLLGKAFARESDGSTCVIGIVQDITERKTADALRIEKEAAESANRAKSAFIANMSHEIRTPLNGVLGMAELLQNTPLNDTQRFYIKTIQGSGKMLLAVINDILDFSKVEAGKMTLTEETLDLIQTVEEAVSPFRSSSNQKVYFIASIAPETPTNLFGDAMRLQQIIGNLLNNAFKFTESGAVRLRVEPTAMEAHRVQLSFQISDTGIGIDSANLQRLFQPFSQVFDSGRRYRGTGLGLIICQRLVQMMQGEIHVQSAPGLGSTFTFSIWLQRSAEPVIKRDDSDVDLTGKTLLAIDDCADYLHIITEQAQSLGMRVTAINQPAASIAEATALLPDIITIDLDMPSINGYVLGQQLAAEPRLAKIPRVLLTASSTLPSAQELATAGFIGADLKPTSAMQLRKLISRILAAAAPEPLKPILATTRNTGKTVLVVEDNAVNREVIVAMLKLLGIDAVVVDDGAAAVQIVTDSISRFDAILMDCEMPGMDGYQATQAIRRHELTMGKSRMPIIALTAHVLPEYKQRSRDAGMDDHLGKPVSVNTLNEVLQRNIRSDVPGTTPQ